MYTRFAIQLAHLLNELPDCQGLAVALSGGLDSMVLLELAQRYAQEKGMPLCAIHIHHGLSANADHWQAFCAEQCRRRGIAFYSEQVVLSEQTRLGIEAKARQARYQAMDKALPAGYALLLGQHSDDQVETFFLRLKRGAGLKGLGGMQALSYWQQRPLLRPLLGISRKQLQHFVERHDLKHIHDESNDDSRFDRNFLRNQILPQLNKRFSGFSAKVAQTTELLQQQQRLLDEIAAQDLTQLSVNSEQLTLAPLMALGEARANNALRYWLQSHDVAMPSQLQLQSLCAQLLSARADSQPSLTLRTHCGDEVSVRRFNEQLYLVQHQVEPIAERLANPGIHALNDGRTLMCQPGVGVRAPNADEQVWVRFGVLNARIRPQHKPYGNKLSHWLKELKVPPWERQRIPLIFYNDTLVAVVGYFYNYDFLAQQGLQWQLTTTLP
ncbi:tRNA lysidine(34) synthetase TilS [Pseudoalteromonas sp. BDTF-M6]|uniref:tRNA lysidine(34) synthetase TilS n=1 Tax=Pseudoalteromonas sp. BDTF-M6 TaxID=2796132 RepID=UPI0020160482|nr:tRNA lysidine(34) synthetase TilS [Pseudoalteromonas sp. BDTF-M6]